MQTPRLNQTASPLAPTPMRRRRMVLLGAGTLVLVLATTGIVAALADRPAPHGNPTSIAAGQQPPSGHAAPKAAGTSPGPSTRPTTAAPVLADGMYPTYVREVDIDGATITIDVVQAFQGKAAAAAAIADGRSPSEAKYLYVYVRNQNPRLRTLPVAPNVQIQFMGTCEQPPSRGEALTELARKTTPFTTTYYYDITVMDGAINQITQRLAISAC
jgi:hypothetical protein